MEAAEQIEKFHELIESKYHSKLLDAIRKENKFLVIDFLDIAKFDPDLADELLENPEEVIKAAELSISRFDLDDEQQNVRIRFHNLPESQNVMIRDIRSKHINKLVMIEGIVKQKSDVRPQVTAAKFECPSCGNIINILQLDGSFREPSRCGCGRKGKFTMLSKELVDAQGMVLEEMPERLEGGDQPKRLNIFLKDDLVSPISDRKTGPGSKLLVIGIIKEVPIILKTGAKSTRFDLIAEANYIRAIEETFQEIEIDSEEEELIKEIANDPKVFKRLIDAIAPSIYGHEKIKEALLLQMMGGIRKVRKDKVTSRGDIHVLLLGDPGSGKCVAGNTKVILEDGEICTIKSFYEKNQNRYNDTGLYSKKVFSINENGLNYASIPTKFWRRKAPKKLIKIVTETGNEIEVTEEHPLFTTENGLIFAKKATEYKKGEFISLPSRINVRGSLQSIPKKIKQSKSNNKVKYQIKEVFDSDFARLFGYLIGDGYVCYRKTTGLISFTNNNPDLLQDFEVLIKSVFGLDVSKRKKRGTDCYEYYVSSIELVRILEKMDKNIVKRSKDMSISKTITKSPNGIVKEFLRSLFDCEGYINNSKREIEISSKSKNLIYDLKYVLLRFGILSQISSALKCATNTKNKIKRTYYRLRISGEDLLKYHKWIGFVSKEKQKKLEMWTTKKKGLNTNLNVVPSIKNLLLCLRKKYGLSQFDFPVSRTTYQHYERGDRFPSYQKLQKISKKYQSMGKDDPLIEILKQISSADIFWDRIKEVIEIDTEDEFVYDLEIEKVHNFIANGVMVHNSQLLKRMSIVAPKARYVSGKGASGAGLCVSPNSNILTNPGGIECIKDKLDPRMKDSKQYSPGVLKEEKKIDFKVQSLDNSLRLQSKSPEAMWKLKAPDRVYEIELQSGKKIEITGNTQLFSIKDGKTFWIKSKDMKKGDYVATPRKLMGGNISKQATVDLLKSNPVVHNIKSFVKELVKRLSKKHGSIRKAAKRTRVAENNLYHNWVKKGARGNIKLKTLDKLSKGAGVDYKNKVKDVSLYNGKKHKIPQFLSKDLLYVAGLIAGDGDIRIVPSGCISVRLSNSCENLHEIFRGMVTKEFNLNFDIQKGNDIRPKATRINSKIFGEIMLALGIPLSPKSSNIDMTETLLHLENGLIAEYLAGLYDTDGSINKRGDRGSHSIELYSCSEQLIRKVQLVFQRFEINARIRKREASKGKIKGKHEKFVLTISGEDILKFKTNIKLRHPEKLKKLDSIKIEKPNTNLDIIPGVQKLLRSKGYRLKSYSSNLSYKKFNKLVKDSNDVELKQLANSDIFWDKVKKVSIKVPHYGFVYDLTVKDSHNFVVDGILVHNTATVVKDEFLKGWSLEAGALVLASDGICMIDEMDKMTPEDTAAMHEALEQQTVSISKANIQATLLARATVLAAANPKFGRFDPYGIIAEQINMPSTLVNRFDLIFPIRDVPEETKDRKLAEHILGLHQAPESADSEIPSEILKKYVAYAKQKSKPILTNSALEEIKNFYLSMRSSGSSEDGVKTIPITARQLEALVRLAEASARVRLSDKVTKKDAKKAIDLVEYCLLQVGLDKETGKIDIDRIATGISASARSHMSTVREIIAELEKKIGKTIPIDDLIDEAKEKGVSEEQVEEAIEKLKRSGDLFEPRRGFISKI